MWFESYEIDVTPLQPLLPSAVLPMVKAQELLCWTTCSALALNLASSTAIIMESTFTIVHTARMPVSLVQVCVFNVCCVCLFVYMHGICTPHP